MLIARQRCLGDAGSGGHGLLGHRGSAPQDRQSFAKAHNLRSIVDGVIAATLGAPRLGAAADLTAERAKTGARMMCWDPLRRFTPPHRSGGQPKADLVGVCSCGLVAHVWSGHTKCAPGPPDWTSRASR